MQIELEFLRILENLGILYVVSGATADNMGVVGKMPPKPEQVWSAQCYGGRDPLNAAIDKIFFPRVQLLRRSATYIDAESDMYKCASLVDQKSFSSGDAYYPFIALIGTPFFYADRVCGANFQLTRRLSGVDSEV